MSPLLSILLLFESNIQGSEGQPAQDIGWPRQVTKDGATLVYYQPQVEDWNNHTTLTVNMAFALRSGNTDEVHGVATLQCGTLIDKEERTVYLKNMTATSVRIPSVEATKAAGWETLFRKLFPVEGETISLDRLIADIEQNTSPAKTVELNNDPPSIFYSARPAILLIVQGDPVLSPVPKTDLRFVVNANWDLFYDKKQKQYFLLAENAWFSAALLSGPWTVTRSLPKDMSRLPAGENFDDVKKMVPPPTAPANVPRVFFSSLPAELIVFKGAPIYTQVPGTSLLYVSNTDNNIFLDKVNSKFYVLLSGRWFGANDLNGPWSYAGNILPKDFSRIPANSPKANVLASVPGTTEASDAVLLAQIPTTAVVNKAEAEAKVRVVYDGDAPQFKPVEGTNMQYAVNTQEKVIRSGDLYYLCFQAVWFMSRSPQGPWKTADMVPAEIYTIPPSSPVYNVTYVVQTNATETTVQSSAAAGYFGAFIIGVGIGACIAYGTGWYHPPYFFWGPGMFYPIYRPWPATYGAGFVYNPWTGGFAGGRRVYGPYGAAGTAAWFNPATGRYGRSASVQGWYGGRTAARSYNPWTGRYAATSQGHNAYSQWGSSVASRNGQWVQTGHVTNAGGTTAGYRTSAGQQGIIHTGANGTLIRGNGNATFAGHDGNVYRKSDNGNWNMYNNQSRSWQKPTGDRSGTTRQLDKASVARNRGQLNTQRFKAQHGRLRRR